MDELLDKISYVESIYISTNCTKSYIKINDLMFVVVNYLNILKQRVPKTVDIDQDTLKLWILESCRAKYILSHLDIQKLSSIRRPKKWDNQTLNCNQEYIRRIQEIWGHSTTKEFMGFCHYSIRISEYGPSTNQIPFRK